LKQVKPLPPIEQRGEVVWLRVRVQPKASRNTISIEEDGQIRASITAPPTDNAANKALCALLAKTLGIAKSNVSVVKGDKSRDKVLEIDGVSMEEVKNFFEPRMNTDKRG
jgi:uncharacterized protein (TIGR00251 family)